MSGHDLLMKESYSEDIMLCFVQGFESNGEHRRYKSESEFPNGVVYEDNNNVKVLRKRPQSKKVLMNVETIPDDSELVDLRPRRKSRELITGKSLRLSSGDGNIKILPEVKRSFSDRFSVVNNVNGRQPKKLLTIRKTWSTGNFAAGGAGGGCGAPRSAPSTPLQIEPHPRMKHDKTDKQAVKPLSSSVPSVRVAALSPGGGQQSGGASGGSDAGEGKAPSKARQKKFFRHFPQVGPQERLLNYYSCALVGDILLQGHLYITKNYFAFYSNVFGYVTKLLIPTSSVLKVSKEKMARIIPNAVGVCTRDERHVFGSLLSRDATYKLMTHVCKLQRATQLQQEQSKQEQRISETELDASEFSVEDETSSAGGDVAEAPSVGKREPEAIINGPGAAVIQPALLTGAPPPIQHKSNGGFTHLLMIALALMLAISAVFLAVRLYETRYSGEDELEKLTGSELYSELVRWRARLHGRAATELQAFLTTNLLLLTKVRQSLEALSGVILTDMAASSGAQPVNMDVTNDTTFS